MKKKDPSKKKSPSPKAAKSGRAKPSKTKAAPAKTATKAKVKSGTKAAKPAKATKATKAAKVTKVTKVTKPAKTTSKLEKDIELVLPSQALKDAGGGSIPREEEAGLEKVMASLSQIFGGKEFLSDAELDAFLDSKMASGEIPPSLALDPLDEAQSLVYEAWNTEGPHKNELARRALDLSPDCADAYVILAKNEARTRDAALDLYRKGVEAGTRALDPSLFAQAEGKFWGIMETRPYMRARLGLAECLWETGKKAEALEHLRHLLVLNPADDQGVRYILLQCLLESGADGEIEALLGRYGNDSSPEIKYTRALWLFRREGASAAAGSSLIEALRANPHVPAYLLKRKPLPKRVPEAAREGSEEEAEAYAHGAMDSWLSTLGALEWLAAARS